MSESDIQKIKHKIQNFLSIVHFVVGYTRTCLYWSNVATRCGTLLFTRTSRRQSVTPLPD